MTSYLRASKYKVKKGLTFGSLLFLVWVYSYSYIRKCILLSSDTMPIWTTFPDDRELEFCLQSVSMDNAIRML